MDLQMPLLLKVTLYKLNQYRYPILIAYLALILKYLTFVNFLLCFEIPFGFSTPEHLIYLLYGFWLFPPDISIFGVNLIVSLSYLPVLIFLYVGYAFLLGFLSSLFVFSTVNAHVKKQQILFEKVVIIRFPIFFGLYLITVSFSFLLYLLSLSLSELSNFILTTITFIAVVLLFPLLFIFPVLTLKYSIKASLQIAITFPKRNKSWLVRFALVFIIIIGVFTFFVLAIARYSLGLMLLFTFFVGYPFVILVSILLIGRVTDVYLKT